MGCNICLTNLHLVKRLYNLSLFINQISATHHTHIGLTVILFLLPYIIGLNCHKFRIGKKGKGQAVFLFKLLMRCYAAHPWFLVFLLYPEECYMQLFSSNAFPLMFAIINYVCSFVNISIHYYLRFSHSVANI